MSEFTHKEVATILDEFFDFAVSGNHGVNDAITNRFTKKVIRLHEKNFHAQLTVANERIAEQDDYIDVIFEQFHAQEIGVIEADERIAKLEGLLSQILKHWNKQDDPCYPPTFTEIKAALK